MAKYFLTGGLAGPWKKEKTDKLSNKPLACSGTITEDAETEKSIVTLDVTAGDIWEAAQNGKQIKVNCSEMSVEFIIPIEIFQVENEETTGYVIKSRPDVTREDDLFMSEFLAADDVVVLTEVAED